MEEKDRFAAPSWQGDWYTNHRLLKLSSGKRCKKLPMLLLSSFILCTTVGYAQPIENAAFVATLTHPWEGEQGIVIASMMLPKHPRPQVSAILYRPDMSSFTMRARPVRASAMLASIRWPQQVKGSIIYVTVEQGAYAWGLPVVVP
jgi:hypothetical protein